MTKTFCDMCGKELDNTSRLEVKYGRFTAEVMTGKNNVGNGAHLCKPCVRKIVAKGKETK